MIAMLFGSIVSLYMMYINAQKLYIQIPSDLFNPAITSRLSLVIYVAMLSICGLMGGFVGVRLCKHYVTVVNKLS
jgi:hypothetical protein